MRDIPTLVYPRCTPPGIYPPVYTVCRYPGCTRQGMYTADVSVVYTAGLTDVHF